MNKPIVKGLFVVAVLVGFSYIFFNYLIKNSQKKIESKVVNTQYETMVKNGAPDFKGKLFSGKPFELNQLKNKLIIINFWASWCSPCIDEFPSMLKLIESFNGDIALVAITEDKNKEDIQDFLNAFNTKKPNVYIVWDKTGELAKLYGSYKLPESFIIKQDRSLVKKIAGTIDWMRPDILRFIDTFF